MKFKLGLLISTVLYLLSHPLSAMTEDPSIDAEKSSVRVQQAHSFLLFTQLRPYVCPHALEQAIQKHHRNDFIGMESFNSFVLLVPRRQHASFTDILDRTFPSTDPSIFSYVRHMENFFRENIEKNPVYINRFLAEIKFQKEISDINLAWLWVMHLRFAASISDVTPPEKDFYQNVTIRNLFFGLLERDAWKNYTSSIVAVKGYDSQGLKSISSGRSSYLSQSNLDAINKAMDECLPMDVVHPVLGTGNFGLCFLVKAYLNNIFPIGIPVRKHTAHSVDLSPLGFAAHDIAHSEIDPRHDNLRLHTIKRVEDYSKQGFDISNVVRIYPSVAAKKYQVLMGCFKKIYQDLVTQFLPRVGLKEFRKAIVGFFQIMHEEPNFPPILYEMNDLDKILKRVTKPTKKDESRDDPFYTSPFDGTSPMSDKEIVDWVIQNRTVEAAQKYTATSVTSTNLSSLSDDIKLFKVTRSNRFINVRLVLKDENILIYAFSTSYYEWHNADDGIRRLRFAGFPFKKPSLDDSIHARKIARTTVDNVENGLQECINYFYKVAIFFSHLDLNGTGNSLNQRYWRWHFNQEQGLAQKFSTFK